MNPPPDHPDRYTMSFGDHLEELRKRILLAILAPIPLMFLAYPFSDRIITWLIIPLREALAANDQPLGLQALNAPEILLTKLKISFLSAIIVSCPWILWQAWLFIKPGLYKHERRFVHLLLPGSAILTAAGVALMYFLMLPLILHVLISVGASLELPDPQADAHPEAVAALQQAIDAQAKDGSGRPALLYENPEDPEPGAVWYNLRESRLYVAFADEDGAVEVVPAPRSASAAIEQQFRLKEYLGFTLLLFLGIVIAFQMPLVILLLGWLRLVSTAWLRAKRKYALFVCAVLSAFLTPADAISMIAMLLPLYGLYELSILLLVVAPAKAVAEGEVFKLRRSEKTVSRSEKPDQTAQSDRDQTTGSSEDES